jgi:hypothetical protein
MALALENSGCAALLSRLPTWQGVLILNYHRIGDCSQSLFDHELWSATAENFDDQLTLLRSRFDVISLPELGSALQNKRGRSVLLTFDDGYRDNVRHALPVLEAHRAPFTMFVCSGFADRTAPLWWLDLEEALERLPSIRLPFPDGVLEGPSGTAEERRTLWRQLYWRLRRHDESVLEQTMRVLVDLAGLLHLTRRLLHGVPKVGVAVGKMHLATNH